ncbi:hypothetical protein HKD37_09G025785 [Glycine soja]
MGEGCCTQPYPCICKEAVSGFEPMINKSPRHNFTAASGLALNKSPTRDLTMIHTLNEFPMEQMMQETREVQVQPKGMEQC